MAEDYKLSDDDKIIQEAKKDFERCEEWEATFQKRFIEDIKFANADSDNMWQWGDTASQVRIDLQKPCLTINKTRQHNLQISNDAKQNKPGVNIRPVGGDATYDAAQVFEGIVRHIEYQSNAEQAYDRASVFQVQGGIGYWRVVTDYVSDESFDQEIYIRPIKDMLSVYIDPDINETDGSDARFGFIFEDVPRKTFEADYPDYADIGNATVGNASDAWMTKDHVRVAEYYQRTQKKDTLVSFVVPMPYQEAGQQIIVRKSKMTADQKAIFELVKDDKENTHTRHIVANEIMWYKIAGNQIIDRRPWLGKYIPIVRVIGEETIIEGKMDRKGHTRAMKDPQRMFNYWSSEATAQVAFQTQSPYIAPAAAIEGRETEWGSANVKTASVLTYNSLDEDGKPIAPPTRVQPPVMATAYVQGMQLCENQLMMASGQYQSQFGQNENATSGKAINERQRQGDNATYHFIDGLAVGIRYTGKIFIDLIPKVYDTDRVIRILAKDGTESQIQIKPDAATAYQQAPAPDDGGQDKAKQTVAAIFNPTVGQYEVESDIGPGYATRRQEGFNAMTQIAAQNPEFMKVGGDLLWKSADFPLADELAERWARTIPPAIMGTGPTPGEEQAQGQIKQMQDAIVKLQQELTDKQQEIDIKGYDATSKRLSALGNSGPAISPEQIQPIVHQIIMQMLSGGSPEQPQGQPQPQGQTDQQPPQQSPMGQPMPDAGLQPDAQQPQGMM